MSASLVIGLAIIGLLSFIAYLYFVPGMPPEGIYDFYTMKGIILHPSEQNKDVFTPRAGEKPGYIIYYMDGDYNGVYNKYKTMDKRTMNEAQGKLVIYTTGDNNFYAHEPNNNMSYNRLMKGFKTPFGWLKYLGPLPPPS